MKVGHFAQAICQKKMTGIGWYTYELIRALSTQGINNEIYGFAFLKRQNITDHLSELFHNRNSNPKDVSIKINPFIHNGLYSRFPWIFSHLSFETLFGKDADIYHAHNYFLPYNMSKPSIITIYDMVYKLHPETMSNENLELLKQIMPRSVSDSTKILTISQNSKAEICEILNVPSDKVHIAYPGYDKNVFKPISDDQSNKTLISLSIKKPYILYVGTIEPRKNIQQLITAFASLKHINSNFDLVLAGAIGWKSEDIIDAIKKFKLEEKVHITGYISQTDQVALYNRASCFVFPSLYEGFGMPLLEAMACECPVITSKSSSMPEVVGDAGLLCDPTDSDSIAHSINRILMDDTLRLDLIEKSRSQIKHFSWDKSAKSVKELYEELV